MKINALYPSNTTAVPTAFRTLPVDPKIWGWNGFNQFNSFDHPATYHNFLMVLGHNLGTYGYNVSFNRSSIEFPSASLTSVVNGGVGGANPVPDYDGFSLWRLDATTTQIGVFINWDGSTFPDPAEAAVGAKVGSVIVGRYYDMPHSPDLKLTMTREMDGVKRIRTKGGNDLVDHRYLKSPLWGNYAPWEFPSTENQALSRVGRRVWDLSWSYLQDSDIFPMLSSLNAYESTSATGTLYSTAAGTTDTADDWFVGETLLDDYTFYNQVIHKTNGGQLPFIFQPNKDDNTEFAIAKLDMKNFSLQQTAPALYNCKLRIKEVW